MGSPVDAQHKAWCPRRRRLAAQHHQVKTTEKMCSVHLPRTRVSHAQFVSVLVPACCRSCTVIVSLTSRTDLTHHAWLKTHGAHCWCLCPKNNHTSSRHVICYTSLDDTEHGPSFLIFESFFLTCPTSTSQRAQTLRRSTATSEWRFGCAPTLHREDVLKFWKMFLKMRSS